MTKLQKDQLMILLESMDSKMQLTVETVCSLNDKIDGVRDELKEDIAVLDCKIMGLSQRVDSVEKNLSERIEAVHQELIAHRNDTEQHLSKPKRPLKRVA